MPRTVLDGRSLSSAAFGLIGTQPTATKAMLALVNLPKFDQGAYISGINAFNHLPQYIKTLVNDQELFKSTLKRFLYHHSFYSMDEYYDARRMEECEPYFVFIFWFLQIHSLIKLNYVTISVFLF